LFTPAIGGNITLRGLTEAGFDFDEPVLWRVT